MANNIGDILNDEQRARLQQVADEQHRREQQRSEARDRSQMLAAIIEQRRRQGFKPIDHFLRWQCPDADRLLMHGLVRMLGDRAQWLPEYDAVAEWLADNRGQGLMCLGNVGRGKSLLTCDIIPMIFEAGYVCEADSGARLARPFVCTARELGDVWTEVQRHRIIVVDEVGQEGVVNQYGEHHDYFDELVMLAERKGKTLILSSNLTKAELFGGTERTADGTERTLTGRYSDQRIRDRLTSTLRRVAFIGDSLRKQTRKGG